MKIAKSQLVRLQTLYSQLARHDNALDSSRQCRLRWAGELCGRSVASFSDLTVDDAKFLIDYVQGVLGVRAPNKARPSRHQARRAGLDGRHDGQEFANDIQIVGKADLARIQNLLEQLNWNENQLQLWLGSTRSPFARRSDKTIRTVADANKVWWGLKRIAKSQGAWRP